jgi:uncharacterized membrane protein (UPF0127 family)
MSTDLWRLPRVRVVGTRLSDTLNGTLDDKKLIGNRGSDVLLGGNGRDVLMGGRGDDTLTGGAGADLFVISRGNDLITDFNPEEGDRVVYRSDPGLLQLPVAEGALLATIDRTYSTTVANVRPSDLFEASEQRLKPTIALQFNSGHGEPFKLESAETDFQQSLGMMQRGKLGKRRGMIFPQDSLVRKSVYMFNCLEPLDILFLDSDVVVDVVHRAPVCTSDASSDCPLFSSGQEFDSLVELRAGTLRRQNIGIGDQLILGSLS